MSNLLKLPLGRARRFATYYGVLHCEKFWISSVRSGPQLQAVCALHHLAENSDERARRLVDNLALFGLSRLLSAPRYAIREQVCLPPLNQQEPSVRPDPSSFARVWEHDIRVNREVQTC